MPRSARRITALERASTRGCSSAAPPASSLTAAGAALPRRGGADRDRRAAGPGGADRPRRRTLRHGAHRRAGRAVDLLPRALLRRLRASAIPPSRSSSCRARRSCRWSKREVDIAIVLEKPEAGRFVTRKLTDYALGHLRLARLPRPASGARDASTTCAGHRARSATSRNMPIRRRSNYVRELYGDAPTAFQCASAIGQLEAVRAGVGLGVVHDFIARAAPGSRPRAARAAAPRAPIGSSNTRICAGSAGSARSTISSSGRSKPIGRYLFGNGDPALAGCRP